MRTTLIEPMAKGFRVVMRNTGVPIAWIETSDPVLIGHTTTIWIHGGMTPQNAQWYRGKWKGEKI